MDSACCNVKEGLYGCRVQHAARVAAVTSQLCVVFVPCYAGSMVEQLLYWLGKVAGYEYFDVTVTGLAVPIQ